MISITYKQKIFLIFISSILFSCKQNDCSFTERLLKEQSKELTLATGRQLYELIGTVNKDNVDQKKETSSEYEQLKKLVDEFENFKAEVKKADKKEMINIINQQNVKFSSDEAFTRKFFKFTPFNIKNYNKLDDALFKYYAESKISEFYVLSGAIIFKRHWRKQNPGII